MPSRARTIMPTRLRRMRADTQSTKYQLFYFSIWKGVLGGYMQLRRLGFLGRPHGTRSSRSGKHVQRMKLSRSQVAVRLQSGCSRSGLVRLAYYVSVPCTRNCRAWGPVSIQKWVYATRNSRGCGNQGVKDKGALNKTTWLYER